MLNKNKFRRFLATLLSNFLQYMRRELKGYTILLNGCHR
jgi:hypothetical protein